LTAELFLSCDEHLDWMTLSERGRVEKIIRASPGTSEKVPSTHWMKALPLASRQSVHIQPRQGSGATGSSRLQGFKFVQSFVKPSGEVSLVSSL
jgi:hypothetical protein